MWSLPWAERGCSRFSLPVTGTFLGERGSLAGPGGCGRGAAPVALRVLRAAHGSQAQGAAGKKAQETSDRERAASSPTEQTQSHSKFDLKEL